MATSAPWVMRDKHGELIGFSVDLAKRLADDLGVRVELVPGSWPNIVPDLLDREFDLIASGLWITPARALQVNYSEPTSVSAVHLVGSRAQAATMQAAADFNKAGVSIVVNEGTAMAQLAARRFPAATLVTVGIDDDPLTPVIEGKAQGAVVMAPIPGAAVAAAGDRLILPAGSELEQAPTALAVRKGDHDFLNFLNSWLTFHRTDGWLAERREYWFVSTDWLKLL